MDMRILGAAAMVPRVRATLSNVRVHQLTVIVPPLANAVATVRLASRADQPCLVFGDGLNMATAAILFVAWRGRVRTEFSNLALAARTVAAGGVSFEPVSAAAILQLARMTSDPRLHQLSAVARSCAQGMRWRDASLAVDQRRLRRQLDLLRALL